MFLISTLKGFENFLELACTCTVRAPVFGRHQFFSTSEHYGKAHGSLLSGWMNYNYTACCWFLHSAIFQYYHHSSDKSGFEKLLIAMLKVPNTGAFTVCIIQKPINCRRNFMEIWRACKFMCHTQHCYMLSVSLIRCKNEAPKKMHLKSTIKCFKEGKIDKWLDLMYLTHFSP